MWSKLAAYNNNNNKSVEVGQTTTKNTPASSLQW